MPDFEDDASPSARPFWSGTITFGLVSLPVRLFAANRGSRVSLHMYSPDGVRLRRRYYSQVSGKQLEDSEIARGYEIEKNNFIVVTDEELEGLAPESSRDIDLRLFVPYADIPKLYFNRAYFLAPSGGSTKAYRLLAETMERQGRAGIATFVMRGKEYLVAIVAENGLLRAETLRFADEIRKPEDLDLPRKTKAAPAALKVFEQIVRENSAEELPRERMKDAESERLLKLVERKQRAEEDVVRTRNRKQEKVVDILQVLQQALAKKGAGSARTKRVRSQAG